MTTAGDPEDFVVRESLTLIHVGKSIGNNLSEVYPQDVYAAVRGWWRGAIHRTKVIMNLCSHETRIAS